MIDATAWVVARDQGVQVEVGAAEASTTWGPRCTPTSTCCLISVYCTADDLLPQRPRNARRKLSDAEIVTLCVAQVVMGIPSDRRFLRAARRQLGHLFPCLPNQDALSQAARPAGRDDRVAGRRSSLPEPRLAAIRSAVARLDPGRMRPLGRDDAPLAAGRQMRLRLLQQPLALVLGNAAAPGLRRRRHSARGDPDGR